jgi:hypothetical protein
MRKKWYLSGSVSNDPDFRDKFAYAEYQLRKRGLKVLNPVKHEKDGKKWSYYLRKDIRKLTRCQGLILLDGGQDSEGASLELTIAHGLGFEVMLFDCTTGLLYSVFEEINK